MRRRIIGALLLALLPGCVVIPWWVASNEPLPAQGGTRATLMLKQSDLPKEGVFVGIAISGGGMRAANFSAAVLLELERLGLLRHASAMSSVSGGSLTAAYYGLFGPVDGKPGTAVSDRWNAAAVRERFLVDLQTHWIIRWFNPWNALRYWTTGFDRSDIMKGVFDFYMLGTPTKRHPTFADMRIGRPKILLNATSIPNARRFVFSEEAFGELGSRLDSYPLSHAVMASGAFPGAFHNVTLESHAHPGRYEHLFDGGPSDNLGTDALIDLLDRATMKLGACFLFLIDAYPYSHNRGRKAFDTRSITDFFLDQNVSDSGSVFLTLTRERTLRRLGLPDDNAPGQLTQWDYKPKHQRYSCRVWHLTFETFFARDFPADQTREELREHREAGRVPTRYRLKTGPTRTEAEVQQILFGAAHYLVRLDGSTLKDACAWFEDKKLTACESP